MPDTRPILVAQRPKSRFDLAGALTRAARETGRSPVKVVMDVICRMCGAQRLTADEYFVQGAWSADKAARAAFVGSASNHRLNLSLIAKGADDQTQLMADKYLSGLVLQANGFPVPELKAVFAAAKMFGSTRTLTSAEELAGWMGEPGQLPAFAKAGSWPGSPIQPASSSAEVSVRVDPNIFAAAKTAFSSGTGNPLACNTRPDRYLSAISCVWSSAPLAISDRFSRWFDADPTNAARAALSADHAPWTKYSSAVSLCAPHIRQITSMTTFTGDRPVSRAARVSAPARSNRDFGRWATRIGRVSGKRMILQVRDAEGKC